MMSRKRCKGNTALHISELQAAIEGKRVAVVGNAKQTLEGEGRLPIDDYDYVIRFNRAMVGTRLGAKTDLLVLAQIGIQQHILSTVRPELILWTRPQKFQEIPKSHDYLNHCDNVIILPKDLLFGLHSDFGTLELKSVGNMMLPKRRVPSTGFIGLWYLLEHCSPASVDIWGFDFWESRSTSSPERATPGPHDYGLERAKLYGMGGFKFIDPKHNDPNQGEIVKKYLK